jgi:hypothetical protein
MLAAVMSGDGKDAMEPGFAAAEIDTSKPHPARMYNAYLGGNDNYPADRAAVRQIGTGIPSAGNVHEVAGRAAPDTRVVYVDNDPIVHVHANALLTGSGTTGIVLADLRDPAAILAHPALLELIDFTKPVALLLVAILHFIRDEEDPAGIVAMLRDSLPAGSYLALSHGTLDFHPPGDADQAAAGYKSATAPLVLRGREQVAAFFDGFDLVEPGLVQAPLWRPEGKRPRPRDLGKIGIYAGVGRKAPAGF